MKPRRLHIAGGLIMLSWFASLGWLVKRQYYADGYPAGVTTSNRLAPGGRFYAVFQDGVQVGTASLSADTIPGGGARVVTRIDVGARDSLRSRLVTLTLTPELTLREWDASASGDGAFSVRGMRGDDGRFRATLAHDSGGVRTLPFEPGRALPVLSAALRASLNTLLTAGDSLVLPVLDPFSASLGQLRMRVLPAQGPAMVIDSAALDPVSGKWVAARRDTVPVMILSQIGMDAPVRLWIDGAGYPVRAELPDGLILQRTAFEIANLNFRNGDRPRGPRAPMLRHRHSTGDPVLAGDTAATLIFPARDSMIAAVARDALQQATSRADSLAALAHWIARRVASGSEGSDAIGVLARRRGSPVGRARLFVAAARHAGVPARLALGLRQTGENMMPELLPQAYADGWRSVDLVHGRIAPDSAVRLLRLRTSGLPFEYEALLASFTRRPE